MDGVRFARKPLSTVFSTILTVCALLITGLVVRREFFLPAPARAVTEQVEVEDWESLLDGGRRVGAREALVQVVEFVDFQCPFCAQATQRINALLEQFPEQLAIVYRHFPIDQLHPYGTEASMAAECAGDQGRFKAFHDALFASQQSIGTEAWSWFAERAALKDLESFESCVREKRPLERVTADRELGESIGVSGTPSFVVDGKLHAGVVGVDAIEALLEAATP